MVRIFVDSIFLDKVDCIKGDEFLYVCLYVMVNNFIIFIDNKFIYLLLMI